MAAGVSRRLNEQGLSVTNLDLDATLEGEPVTVNEAGAIWQGCALHEAPAIWLEMPVFPWPQALPPPFPIPDTENFRRWHTYQRESRALASSALALAADHVPIMNHPASSHLAVAPTVALDLLGSAGLPIQPWSLGSPPETGELILDATGRDRWHPAEALPDTAPRLGFAAVDGPVYEMLVIGDKIAGTFLWNDGPAWVAPQSTPTVINAPADLELLGKRAAEILNLEMIQVACAYGEGGPLLLGADAAPRLGVWNELLAGGLGAVLAQRLAILASTSEGKTV
ncbi:MAG: hypothetical protein KAH56_04275 [Candidatus Krumholzibacteria bacterium]|nr:hypothetical protein [Candidatus Krumholzibacteria bacterium]